MHLTLHCNLHQKHVIHDYKEDSTCFVSGAGEMLDFPLAPCAPAGAHSEVRDVEGLIGVHPLHDYSSVQTVAHQQSAAAPLKQEFFKLIRIHDSWCWD